MPSTPRPGRVDRGGAGHVHQDLVHLGGQTSRSVSSASDVSVRHIAGPRQDAARSPARCGASRWILAPRQIDLKIEMRAAVRLRVIWS